VSANPPRFCANCGFAAQPSDVNCSNCGAALAAAPAAPPPAGPAPSFGTPAPGAGFGTPAAGPGFGSPAPAPRGGIPGWAIGLIACVVIAPIMVLVVGIIAAVAIPGFNKFQGSSQSAAASSNLKAIWAAEQAYAKNHDGDYSEFYIDQYDQEDEGWTALGITLPKYDHTYEGYYEDQDFYLSASGNTDSDPFLDSWELSAKDGNPVHLTDDSNDTTLAEGHGGSSGYEGTGGTLGSNVGGGGGSAKGLEGDPVVSEVDPSVVQAMLETDDKSQTAKSNLEAIWVREKSYKLGHKSYLPFDDGTASTWGTLGVKLPAKTNHTYSAKVDGGKLVLSASANLDDDPFLDEWEIDTASGVALQTKNDALNIDLSELSQGLAEKKTE
jgi:type II secretory pathway pseudopilin PulG